MPRRRNGPGPVKTLETGLDTTPQSVQTDEPVLKIQIGPELKFSSEVSSEEFYFLMSVNMGVLR